MNKSTTIKKAWLVQAKDVKIDIYQMIIDWFIEPAIFVIADAGISADKCDILRESIPKKNVKAGKN